MYATLPRLRISRCIMMIERRLGLSELLCAVLCSSVLCTTVMHNDTHRRKQFLKFSLSLGLAFVCSFRFSILCFSVLT